MIGDTVITKGRNGGYSIETRVDKYGRIGDWTFTLWGARRVARRQRRNALRWERNKGFREVVR